MSDERRAGKTFNLLVFTFYLSSFHLNCNETFHARSGLKRALSRWFREGEKRVMQEKERSLTLYLCYYLYYLYYQNL